MAGWRGLVVDGLDVAGFVERCVPGVGVAAEAKGGFGGGGRDEGVRAG